MPAAREAVIVDTCRTAFGKRGGALANWHPVDLLAHTLSHVVTKTGVDPERIDDVIGGCVSQVGEQSTNVARNAWVAAGLPQSVPATTVDRQCGSSQQAVHFAAAGVVAGHYDLAIACGVESMSRVPLASNARGGVGPFPKSFLDVIDGRLWMQFRVAQVLADQWKITRQDMDEYALESHRRAAAATDSGHFAKEAIPVPIRDDEGTLTDQMLSTDEGIRRDTSLERLASLPPAEPFEPETAPDITAGNSSQMTDGAAAMLVAERSVAERLGLPVRARFHAFAVAAEDAAIVLSAPVPATRKLLERTGMSVDDFDAIECNEAFAAIALMWARAFSPDPDRLNPRGGAIAIGHPLGASGVRLMTTLLNELEATGGRYGFQTMCEGGGQANATVIERLAGSLTPTPTPHPDPTPDDRLVDFTFSAEQDAFRSAVRGALATEAPPAYVRAMIDDPVGVTPELWATMAELGWLGVLVPESAGGLGLGLVDVVVLQEEMGALPFPGPLLSSAVAATLAAVRLGVDEVLEDLAAGRRRGTVAVEEPGHGDPLRTVKARAGRDERDGAEWVLQGTKPLVLDGAHADFALVVAHDGDGMATFLLEAPAGEPVPVLDVTRKLSRVVLDGRRARRVGPAGDHELLWRRILDDVNVALCAELVGTSERALELAVEYAKVRVQFDRPIATFQVIKHKAADMLHRLELARVGTHYAAWASDADDPERERAAAMCKGYVSEAADAVTAECIQVHGGVGFTWDIDCHLLYRRAKQDDLLFGVQGFQRSRLADLLLGVTRP